MARLPKITAVSNDVCDPSVMEIVNCRQMIILMTMRLIIMTL